MSVSVECSVWESRPFLSSSELSDFLPSTAPKLPSSVMCPLVETLVRNGAPHYIYTISDNENNFECSFKQSCID